MLEKGLLDPAKFWVGVNFTVQILFYFASALTVLLFAQLSAAQVTLFSDDFELQSESVWSSHSSFFSQLSTTQAIKKSGLSSVHRSSANRSVSQQTLSPIGTGRVRLSWWVYNNDSTQYDLASFGFYSSNEMASLSFEIAGNGIVTIASDAILSDYKSDLGVIGSKKWQEMSIDYDFDTAEAVFSFDGSVVHKTTISLSDLAIISFRTDDSELYIDDVKVEQTVIQTNSELTDILSEGFEQGAILGWQAQASDSSVLDITSQVSRTGAYAVSGVANSSISAAMTRPLIPIMDGTVTASAWLRSAGSQESVLGELFLGDGLVIKLIQKEGTFSAFANQQKISAQNGEAFNQTGMSSIDLSGSGEWVQLSISYNFATQTAAFLANGSEFYTIKVAVNSIAEIRISAADSQVYMDDVAVTYTPPVRFTQTPANLLSESINLSATEVDGNASISWNSVRNSDGYRLYFSPQAFSNTSEAQSVDLGQSTSLGAALPRGSNYYIVVSAHANGEDIAFSNMQQLTIPFVDILLTTKLDSRKLQANWSPVTDADTYRLYYSGSAFSEITTQSFVSFDAQQLALETELPFPSNYYIAIAAVKGETIVSNLSNLEQISLGNNQPVFAEPYQNPNWINDCDMNVPLGGNRQYSEEEALDFFILNGGNSPSALTVVRRPLIPKVPELQELTMTSTSGKPSSTKIKANLVTRKIGQNETQCGPNRNDYIIHTDYTTFRHRDLVDIYYYASNLRATQTRTLGLAFDVTFGEEDIGNAVNFAIYQVNDAGKVLKAERLEPPSWNELIENTNPFIARGVAKVGTHEAKVVELTDFRSRTDEGMAGGFGVVLRYESTGLDGVTHEYISEPVIYSIQGEFQKLDSNGAVLADNAPQWACFRDTRTGLIWESKTQDGGLHDAKHTYSQYSSDSLKSQIGDSALENGGKCSDSINCDTEKFVQQVNAAGLCGANDWRLPDIEELKQLNLKTAVRSPFYAHRYLQIADSTWTSTLHDGNYAFYQRMWGWSENFRRTPTGQPAPLSTPASSALKVILVREPL